MAKKTVFNWFDSFVGFLSLEFLLTKANWPNGGTVIFIRTFCITSYLSIFYGAAVQVLDPGREFAFSLSEFQLQLINTLNVFGAVFAGVYVAIYSRYSSQWSYLANVYNQIKAAESASGVNDQVIHYWKAAFIEDAVELHLVRKKMFAMIVKVWSSQKEVRNVFKKTVPDGKALIKRTRSEVRDICKKDVPKVKKHEKKEGKKF